MTTMLLACFLLCLASSVQGENIISNQVFVIPIVPSIFNWSSQYSQAGYSYRPTLTGSPDLPSWLHYEYNDKSRTGYLFGVPPSGNRIYNAVIIAVDRDNYQTVRKYIQLNVTENPDLAKHEVLLKIDNLNVYDMFENDRIKSLKNVFTKNLWTESSDDLHLTFIISATKLGARAPLRPDQSNGVVLRIASKAPFSNQLLALQMELKPLAKLQHCPREFKRTSVDRLFRPNFIMDWCSFKLITLEDKKDIFDIETDEPKIIDWRLPVLAELPSRNFSSDFISTIVLPVVVLLLMALLLSVVLCFHHQSLGKDLDTDESIAQYEVVQRATGTLRSMSNMRDTGRLHGFVSERKEPGRPSPPPYGATRRILNKDS